MALSRSLFAAAPLLRVTAARLRAMAASTSVESVAAKLAGSLGFALRKSRRVLRDGPRKDIIVESIAVALSLLSELADTKPEFVKAGGLEKLATLACGNGKRPLGMPTLSLDAAPPVVSETRYVDIETEVVESDHMQTDQDTVAEETVASVASVCMQKVNTLKLTEEQSAGEDIAVVSKKGVGSSSSLRTSRLPGRTIGSAPSTSASSTSLCPSSLSSERPLDGAKVGSGRPLTGKGIGALRMHVGSTPALCAESFESNSDLSDSGLSEETPDEIVEAALRARATSGYVTYGHPALRR